MDDFWTLSKGPMAMEVHLDCMRCRHCISWTISERFTCTGCPKKKGTFRMLLEPRCTCSITSSWHPSHPDSDELLSANDFFGRFLVRLLSKIKRSQVMSIGHFGPPALNFGYDFWALATFWSHFFWNTLHRLQKKVQGEFSLLANVALYSKECYQPYQSLTFAT